jgi:hypothetical protein
VGLWERLRSIRKGPLAVAGLLGAPLFFCSLMAASLAIDRPRVVSWTHNGKLITRYHDTAASVEARIWLWSLVPLALLIGVGLLASLWRFGGFVSCAAGIVLALAVTRRVNEWAAHHTARWPRGIDNIPDKWSSDQVPRGAWEKNAAQTAFSLSHWTIGLGIAIVLVYLLLIYRRQRARARVALVEAAGMNESSTPAVP